MKKIFEALQKLQDFVTWIEQQVNQKVKHFDLITEGNLIAKNPKPGSKKLELSES